MDDLDRILSPSRPADETPAGKENVWRQMTAVLRWRRRLRQASRVGVIVLVYAAGVGSMWLMQPADSATPAVADNRLVDPATIPVVKQPARPDSPAVMERLASRSTGSRCAALYRRAGDQYLDFGDMAAAVRCYRRALEAGSTDDLVVDSSDSWLLISMKTARQKERNDVRN